MLLSSNVGKTYKVAVVPSEFTSNIAEFGAPMFRLESLKPKEDDKEKLPAGYTRVGWIAGVGDALVNTEYYPNHNSEILIDRSGLMDYTFGMFGCGSLWQVGSGEGYTVIGITAYGAMVSCMFGSLSDPEVSILPIPHEDVGWDPYSSGENPFEGYEAEIAETRYSIYMSKDELKVGPNSVPNPATPASIDPWPIPFTLFGIIMLNSGGSYSGAEPIPDMIFSFKVYENGVPVVNMLPCIEDATGQPGFYDTVRNVFITGEGMFFTGDISEPEPLPTNLYIFNTCTHYSQVGEIYPSYIRKISDWNYYLNNLQIGGDENGSMFSKADGSENFTLKSFNVDLPALTEGAGMFYNCRGLTSFTGELPALTNGGSMFQYTKLTSWYIELPNLTDGGSMFSDTGLTSFTSDLPNLTNGGSMFNGCTKLTSFTGDLPALTNGERMFYQCTGLTSWDIELPNLTDGTEMFRYCKGLTSWDIELPNLTSGSTMFYGCTGLTSFTGDLPALTSGNSMFWNCPGLASFTGNLPALTNGRGMFFNTGLTSFTGNLPALTNGNSMFYGTGLTSFTGDLPALIDGNSMFYKCTGLTSFTGDLSALTDGTYMFYNCTGLTSFTGDLSALTDGEDMFAHTGLTSWDIELPSLTRGDSMFFNTGLTSFTSDLPALTYGYMMFWNCTALTSFTGELPALTSGSNMFSSTGLTSWDIELPNLTNGERMFSNTGLTSWDIELPNLTDGERMFSSTGLTSWDIELPKLTTGWYMFSWCTGLTSFTGDLPALTDGRYMFGSDNSTCTKLDLASVQHISNTINDLASAGKTGTLAIGIDPSLRDTEELETALAAIRAKGWTVTEMYRS